VGGIKEKLLAARAAGLKRVLVPARNMPEVHAEAQEALAGGELEVIPVTHVHDALAAAFDPPYLLLPRSRL
jgi:ATP-dependent Lon protease